MATVIYWTEAEDNILRTLAAKGALRPELEAALPGRTWRGIRAQRCKVVLHKAAPKVEAAATPELPQVKPQEPVKVLFKESEDGMEATIESTRGSMICTLDQLLEYGRVDLDVWEVKHHDLNAWTTTAKNMAGEMGQMQNMQVKAHLVRRVEELALKKAAAQILAEIRAAVLPHGPRTYPPNESGHLVELDFMDLHLGKLCWSMETGGPDYDLKIAEAAARAAFADLAAYYMQFRPARFLIPIGNDLFNVDSRKNMTSAGTPQDCDGRQQKAFMVARRLWVEFVLELVEIAPVDVVMVSGNHDTEVVFYLGEVLDAYFHADSNVTVNNSPAQRKYYRWGLNLLCFTHGNEEKHKDLPILMALEQPEWWGTAKYREVHTGHVHSQHNKSYAVNTDLTENMSVIIRQLPSLTSADAWHASKGYLSRRAAQAMLWHETKGPVAVFSASPK